MRDSRTETGGGRLDAIENPEKETRRLIGMTQKERWMINFGCRDNEEVGDSKLTGPSCPHYCRKTGNWKGEESMSDPKTKKNQRHDETSGYGEKVSGKEKNPRAEGDAPKMELSLAGFSGSRKEEKNDSGSEILAR